MAMDSGVCPLPVPQHGPPPPPRPGVIGMKKNVRSPPLPLSKSPEIIIGDFGTIVLCVPQGHVQGVRQLFTLNSLSL